MCLDQSMDIKIDKKKTLTLFFMLFASFLVINLKKIEFFDNATFSERVITETKLCFTIKFALLLRKTKPHMFFFLLCN